MSGLEALGLAANLVQIIGFAGEAAVKLKWCLDESRDARNAPKVVNEAVVSLPAFEATLKNVDREIKEMAPAHETGGEFFERYKPIKSLVLSCEDDLRKLVDILAKVVPAEDATKRARIKAAWATIRKDGKLESILERLKKNMDLIETHQNTVKKFWLVREMKQLREDTQGTGPVGMKIDQLSLDFHTIMESLALPLDEINDVVKEMSKGQNQNRTAIEEKLDTLISLHKKAELQTPTTRQDVQRAFENIPMARKVGDFVDRPKITQEIEDKFADPANTKRTVVLRGMGGNGKTQLAMDFALSAYGDCYDSVFWVDATSEASALRSFQEIAEKLTHPAPKFDDDRARIEFVERKLKEWDYDFLMVLDNYDDVVAFKQHKLPAFMPHCRTGHYLITSRLSPYDQDLGRLCTFVVEVGDMEEKEAVDLLVKKAFLPQGPGPTGDYSFHANTIVKRLGYHALAIDLSAAYILKQTIGLDEFLGHFERRKQKILSEPPAGMWEYQNNAGVDERAKNLAVFTSWDMSYEKLQSDEGGGKAPACLLNLLAFLYKQGVSENIFYWNHKSMFNSEDEFPDWLKFFVDDEDQWDSLKFGDAVSDLRKRSLISSFERTGGRIRGITLHPLVKDWIKMRLGTEKGASEEQRRLTIETTNLVHVFLKSQKSLVETFEMNVDLKPEALSYVDACRENLDEFCKGGRRGNAKRLGEGELADAGETFALFYEYMGKISEAEGLFTTLINWRKSSVTNEDPALLRAKSLYTEVLRLQKNFAEAKRWDREVYDTRMELLAKKGVTVLNWATYEKADQPTQDLMKDGLWSSHDLGWDLEALGDVEEAEKLQRDAYEGRRQILGQNNPSTLQSTNNLAHTLRRQGKTLEALALMRETLQIGRDVFQTGHHSEILQFKSNLQDVLRFNAELEEAEAMARESYDDTCAEWGIDHLKAAASRGQLKDILWDRNKAKEAEEIATKNLEIMANSPYSTDISRIDDIALLLDTLSGRQMTDGGSSRRDEILGHADRAYDLVKQLSPEDLNLPSTLQDLIYLSTGLEVLRASKQLIKLEPIIFEHCKKVFGISDRNSINSLVRLSSALRVEGKKKEADQECHKAIDELRANLSCGMTGGTKSTHLAALSWLAVLYKHMGDQRSAMEVYDKAYDYVMTDNFISNADYETLYSIQGLAEDIDDQRRCQKAEVLHNAVLKTREKNYGEHPCVDDSLYAYSWNLRLQDRLIEAERVCQRALKIATKFRGPHRNTMCILKRLAYLEEQLGKHEAAEGHYREVLAGFRALGTRHITRVTEALEDLQELLMEQRKWEEARALIQDAMKRREEGWDRNMGHYAGLIRHLAIVTWEIGDGVEGLRLYRKARRTYEVAWGLDKMKEGRQKQNLIRRINELLPGTENMEEEMRIEEEQKQEAAQEANDAAAQKNADLDALDDGQKTPTAIQDVKAALQDIQQQMGPSHVGWDGATQIYQMSTKDNQEATVENGGLSLSRQTTLGANSLPEAPSHEPSKLNETSTNLDEVTRRMGQANLGQ